MCPNDLGNVYTGPLEWFYVESSCVGADRLPIYIHNVLEQFCAEPFLSPFWEFARGHLGTVPNGIYFLFGPVWVRLAVLVGTVLIGFAYTMLNNVKFLYFKIFQSF